MMTNAVTLLEGFLSAWNESRTLTAVPGRKGWWTDQQSALGNSKTFTAAELATRGQVIPVASVPSEIGPPRPITVCLQRETLLYDPDTNWDVRAIITFGSGATTQRIVCDWNPGTQLNVSSVGGIWVDLETYDPNPNPTIDYSVPNTLTANLLKVAVSMGAEGSGHPQPRRTVRQVEIPPESVGGVVIPVPWAESLQVGLRGASPEAAEDPYTGDVSLQWIDTNGIVISVVPGPSLLNSWLPIPAGARARIINVSADAPITPTFIWRLSL